MMCDCLFQAYLSRRLDVYDDLIVLRIHFPKRSTETFEHDITQHDLIENI